jgi:hypothetical protein
VSIVPIGDLPDSQQKNWLLNLPARDEIFMSSLNWMPPSSALVVSYRVEPFIHDPAQTGQLREDATAIHSLIADVTLALTLVGPRAPIQAAHWFILDDPDLEEASLLRGSRGHSHIEILPFRDGNYPPLDPIEAPQIVQGYLALETQTKNKVRVALERLGQAQNRRSLGDRAVELSIALETLMGDNATTEMTHKIKVRSVRLIGGSDEVRKKNSAVMNKAYSIRSSLVHTGH